jgi:two-component system, OmpR family, phosphate regulon response regulator PhoB
MTHTATVILTPHNRDLLVVLREHRPDLNALVIDRHIDEADLQGSLWCFVDWTLPDISGLEMCRRLRSGAATRHAHITMILDEQDDRAQQRALKAGANDYIMGPLQPDQFLGRLQIYQKAERLAPPTSKLVHGNLVLDLAAQYLRFGGKPVAIGPNEFHLLAHFMENPDKIFSRRRLIDIFGKDNDAIDQRTVDVWVGRLRRCLARHEIPDPLRTVRSRGYVLDSMEGN